MSFQVGTPYNDLPKLPPHIDLESKNILKVLVEAKSAIASLRASNKRLPNESLLANTVILQEAKLSSEIENIVTTNDELYQSLATEKAFEPHMKEVLSYPHAMWHGYNFVREKGFMNTRVFIEIMQIIKSTGEDVRKIPGTKIANPSTGKVVYTPPEGEGIIRDKLDELEQFINHEHADIDPLIQMALAHYQFEAIHPFHDGNGRTGRVLNILFLVQAGLLDQPVLYLSKYILENKSDYYLKLRNVTEQEAWEEWILYMLQAVGETAKYTEDKIESICNLMDQVSDQIKSASPKMHSKELIEVLFQLPYSKRKFLVDAGIASEKTAGKYLRELEQIGILKVEKIGREKVYFNKDFFDLLKK